MLKEYNPHFKETILQGYKKQHFLGLIGFELSKIELGHIERLMVIEQKHQQQYGNLHGGLIATLADTVAGYAAFTAVAPGHGVVTGELKVSYFEPGFGDKVLAIGKVVRQGRKINFCEAEIWVMRGEEKVLIAKASATMITVQPRK
jgi:uncharacterized protein (TIGR00369 family)